MVRTYITLGLVLLMAAVILPVGARAQTANTSTEVQISTAISTLQTQVDALVQQITALKAQLQKAREAQQNVIGTLQLLRSMRQGMSGDDIKALQQILASDPSLYPEGVVSGIYGPLTKKAVARFQEEHGIEGVGEVGPQTLRLLNALLKGMGSTTPGLLKIEMKESHSESGDDDRKTASSTANWEINQKKITICHKPYFGSQGGEVITIATPALNAHLMHGDNVGPCEGTSGGPGNGGNNGGDSIAPIISGLATSQTTASTTAISWHTNENATAILRFGTSTPVLDDPGATVVNYTTLSTFPIFTVTGLAPSTTYYYLGVATDASGNSATSSTQSFTTLGL